MENIICGISALRFYRTPPAVLNLFEPLPITRDRATRLNLKKQPLAQYVLGIPLHFLTPGQTPRSRATHIKYDRWAGKIPEGAIREIGSAGAITSPEMTLLLLARTLPTAQLALLMYEFCGTFTIYEMPAKLKEYLAQNNTEPPAIRSSWQQVKNSAGNPINMWNRPPLITIDRLQEFADLQHSAYAGNNFYKAASMVAGVTRSPLEAEASLLLSLPRKRGGYGFKLETNRTIPLGRKAKKIYPHEYCVADIYLESPDGQHIVDVECQGAAIHAGEAAASSDANRTTALETMGISVVQITHADIHSTARLELIAEHICNKLEIKHRKRTANMTKAERQIRSQLPNNWEELSV